ncbi:MAG: outer membrane beta-barrel protein [Rhizobiales bacterium]|nr:outer membrane beta-barrel protein [Hyphomicrobiales bacterium]
MPRIFATWALAACLLAGLSSYDIRSASAGDWAEPQSHGNFMIRVLGAGVLPDTEIGISTGGGPVNPALGADVTDAFIPAATLTYFFSPNMAVELFCCVAQHEVKGEGAVLGPVGELAETWIFPPTVTLQYHFTGMGNIKPYVGAGVTYINFFDTKPGAGAINALGATSASIDDEWGFALQAGIDVSLGDNWWLTADVKKIFLDTEARWVTNNALNPIVADVELDPWVVSFGLGYRFDLFSRHTASMK